MNHRWNYDLYPLDAVAKRTGSEPEQLEAQLAISRRACACLERRLADATRRNRELEADLRIARALVDDPPERLDIRAVCVLSPLLALFLACAYAGLPIVASGLAARVAEFVR